MASITPLHRTFIPQLTQRRRRLSLASVLVYAAALLVAASFAAQAQEKSVVGGVTLVGDTSRPDISTFAQGENVELTFAVDGLKMLRESVMLELFIADEHGKQIEATKIPVQADASGHWQTKITAPHSRLGFYRVYAGLSNGVPLQAAGSRGAGFLTYAVVPDPAKRRDYGEEGSRFGMQGGFGPWADRVLALLGARWVLDGSLEWQKQEPEHAGQFGPEQARQYAADSSARASSWHQYTLPTLMRAPQWAVMPETFAYMTGTLTPDGEKAWSAYCKAAARAYAAKNPDRKEHIYQITWEPIPPWGFKGTDAGLIRIHQLAYQALHEADPKAVVAGPTRGIYNNGDPPATVRLFERGLGNYLDGYTAHPYYSMTPEQDGMTQAVRTVKALLRTSTKRNLPMFGTEQGWSTEEDSSKDLLQAQGLLRQNLILLGEGFRFNFAFYIADYRLSGQKGYGYYYTLDKDVPFGPQKISPRPVAAAYAAQSRLLDGCKSGGTIEWLGDKVWGYVFEQPDRRILAVWSYGKEARAVSLPTGVEQVHVFDWMGNERTAKTVAGNITVTLGPEPVYISGVSPKLWGSTAVKALTVRQSRLQSYPGGRVSIAGSALMPADRSFRGTLLLETEKAWGMPPLSQPVSLGTSKRASFHFDLRVPAALHSGTYTARLLLHNATGRTVYATAITLEVALPVSVGVESLFRADGKPGVVVTLQDKQGQGIAGRLDFRLKELLPGAQRSDLPMIDLVEDPAQAREVAGTSRQVPFNVSAGGRRRLILTLPDATLSPTRHYQALVTLTPTNGAKFAQTASVDFVPATYLRRPVTIDGDLSDWAATPTVSLSGPQDVIRSPQLYPPGLAAQLRFAWDAKALYIAAEVKDDIFHQDFTGVDTWRGDCLQLAFNLDPQIPNAALNASDRRTSELAVALTRNGPEAYRHLSFAPDKLALGALSPPQIQLAIRRSGEGRLIYEIAIPWTSLGLAAGRPRKAGDTLGIAATVNEVRSAEQTDPCALGLFGGIAPTKDPDKFGTLVLAGVDIMPSFCSRQRLQDFQSQTRKIALPKRRKMKTRFLSGIAAICLVTSAFPFWGANGALAQTPRNPAPAPVADPAKFASLTPDAGDGDYIVRPPYANAPELTPRADVPKGMVYRFTMNSTDSKLYPGISKTAPGTVVPYQRRVSVYVPSQYVPGTPAPFLVSQDSMGAGSLPTILDNLIAGHRLPALIAVMIDSGGGDAQGSERGLEYDTVSGRYAEFIETEVLPRIAQDYHVTFTKNPEGRMSMGGSSGGAAAFTMAWFRPDLYHRVLTYSGTYVNQQSPLNPASPHGAWEYHEHFLPQSKRKPLRIWMEVGENDIRSHDDESTLHNWVLANQRMAAVLKAKRYHYQFVFAQGAGHVDGRVVAQTLPQALEWVWKGYPMKAAKGADAAPAAK